MISRRILRIKAMQTLYSFYQGGDMDLVKSEKELMYSIEKSYDLYFYLMLLGINVVDYARQQIETRKQKFRPSDEELNPNMKFVDNRFVAQLRENKCLNERIDHKKLSWVNNMDIPKRIFNDLEATDTYKQYMADPETSYTKDKELIIFMFQEIISECDELYKTLEDLSVYWIDTAEFILGMVLRTFGRYKVGFDESYQLMGMFKSQDDKDFVQKLFRKAVAKNNEYRKLISDNAQNWDLERIAFLDIVILQVAMAEVETFPEIPLRVTFNEYIELAKNFSTEKSPIFINGILDKIVQQLKESGAITKIAEMPEDR